MAEEILGLPVVPGVVVELNYLLILIYRLKLGDLRNHNENSAGLDPVEEEDDLVEEPGAHIVNIIMPHAEVQFHDKDNI